MECSADGCDRKAKAKGMCGMHYLRWDRARDPERYREYDRKHKAENKEKLRKRAKAAYDADPERHIQYARRSIIKRKYGLTLEDYEARLAEGCSICGEHGPRMAMDHCHATGKVREPLCANCNNGLGRFFDKPELLRAAADYLEKHFEPE